MRKHLFLEAFVAAIFFAAAAATIGVGQTKTGGYRKISVDDAAVVAAAEIAVAAQIENLGVEIELDEILKAERQAVAGTNFRLCLRVIVIDDADEPYEQLASVVVFQNLKKEYESKSWAETENCQ